MTGRQRLEAIMGKAKKDRFSWTTLVDNHSLNGFPEHLRGNGGIDFYRHLGCDILLLNGWNTPYNCKSAHLSWAGHVKTANHPNGVQETRTWHTGNGKLEAVYQNGHPVKYPVDSIEAVHIYTEMWETAVFSDADDTGVYDAINCLIGGDGITVRFWGPSAIPRLLENDMGTQNFYYMYCDYPDRMDTLINTMHEQYLKAFEILAKGPWNTIMLVENTSTHYISPEIYKKYNMPHQRDFVRIIKNAGKTAILHMCGHVRGILDLIRETGCDGIHALTPPPTGDTPWEDALDIIGEDLIILGVLDPSIFISGKLENIAVELDRLITPRIRESNFVLCPCADGIRVPLERFLAVKEWISK